MWHCTYTVTRHPPIHRYVSPNTPHLYSSSAVQRLRWKRRNTQSTTRESPYRCIQRHADNSDARGRDHRRLSFRLLRFREDAFTKQGKRERPFDRGKSRKDSEARHTGCPTRLLFVLRLSMRVCPAEIQERSRTKGRLTLTSVGCFSSRIFFSSA